MSSTRIRVPAEFYNTDCGPKMSISRALEECPNKVSIMRSRRKRFPPTAPLAVTPFGSYNIESAHKKGITSTVRDCKRFYSSPFTCRESHSRIPRSGKKVPEVYDVQTLHNGAAPTFADSLSKSNIQYTMMRSKQPRVARPTPTAAPDVVYAVDSGSKACFLTGIENSPILYANVSSSTVRKSTMAAPSSCPAEIGPGSYDVPIRSDIRTSLVLKQNPLSSMISRAPRMAADKLDPTKNLGSTWKLETDQKHWDRATTICKAARQV